MTKLNTTNQMVREFERVLGKPRLKQHEQAKVPVYDRNGRVVATVRKECTSVGAAKAAKVQACEWSFRFGTAGWVTKGA
jgi:hypothetical protein